MGKGSSIIAIMSWFFASAACGGSIDSAKSPGGASGKVLPLAGEWSLGERERWGHARDEMQEWLDRVNTACGTQMSAAWDYESFRGHMEDDTTYGVNAWLQVACEGAFGQVKDVCEGGDGKASVKRKISRIDCSYGQKGKTHVELAGATLRCSMDPDAGHSAMEEAASQYLKSNL